MCLAFDSSDTLAEGCIIIIPADFDTRPYSVRCFLAQAGVFRVM